MVEISRRSFAKSASMFLGVTAAFPVGAKIFAQEDGSGRVPGGGLRGTESREANLLMARTPVNMSAQFVTDAKEAHDSSIALTQALTELLDVLVPSREVTPLRNTLAQVSAARIASKAGIDRFVEHAATRGVPLNFEVFTRDAVHAQTLFAGPFTNAVEAWVRRSSAADAAVPPEVFLDPQFTDLFATCGIGVAPPPMALAAAPSGGGGAGAVTVGQLLLSLTVCDALRDLILIAWLVLLALAIIAVGAIIDAFGGNAACLDATALVRVTVDFALPPADFGAVVDGFFARAGRTAQQKLDVAAKIAAELATEPIGSPRAFRLVTLLSEVQNSPC